MDGNRSAPVVAITGMHRSGTSMVAQILERCGLYLGEPEQLLGPSAANPDGYFEHLEFLQLGDDILAVLGGGWDAPPRGLMWRRRRLAPLLRRARALADTMAPYAPWGWKDPRTCLTLPLWLKIVPNLQVVVCVRDVSEVAHSLRVRNEMPLPVATQLWLDYNRRLLRAAPRGRTIVTRYESFFAAPEREIERVVQLIGLAASKETIANAAATIKPALRHHDGRAPRLALPQRVARVQRQLEALGRSEFSAVIGQ